MEVINKAIKKYKKRYPELKDLNLSCDRIINKFVHNNNNEAFYKRQILITTPDEIPENMVISEIWDEDDEPKFKSLTLNNENHKIVGVYTFFYESLGETIELIESHAELNLLEKERHVSSFFTKIMASIDWDDSELIKFIEKK